MGDITRAPSPPLAGRASFLLSQLGTRSAQEFANRLAPLGMRPSHFGLLMHLSHDEGQSQQQLADALGIHRNVIHPRFGNFILLATLLVDSPISEYGQPLDYSPCLECKLCVAACPVGAIKKNGDFDFVAC